MASYTPLGRAPKSWCNFIVVFTTLAGIAIGVGLLVHYSSSPSSGLSNLSIIVDNSSSSSSGALLTSSSSSSSTGSAATDACSLTPGICQNSGVCSPLLVSPGYNCTCPSQYSGVNCTNTLCSLNPGICQNGGSCAPAPVLPYYNCTCAAGFNLTNCTGLVNYCDSNPCGIGTNPGAVSCASIPGPVSNYSCGCANGYSNIGFASTCYLPFVSTWNTSMTGTSNSSQIALPLVSNGAYNSLVNWGDGTSSTITAYTQSTHTYASPGIYNVNVTGLFKGFSFNNAGDKLKLLSISQFGSLSFANNGGYFYGCTNLQITATDNLNLIGTTTLLNAFKGCAALTTIPSASTWNTAGVTTLNSAFFGCSKFNQPVGNWNTSSVVDFTGVFNSAAVFNQPLNSWDTSQATVMVTTFASAAAFNQPLTNWNTAKVTDMGSMFQGASAFNSPIGTWNIAAVTSLSQTFRTASSFNQPLGNWSTANVKDFTTTFYFTPAFNQPLGSWNTSGATTMAGMFQNNNLFNQDISTWNVSSVTLMTNMFNSASAFNQNLGLWDVRKVTDMTGMFASVTLSTSNYNALLIGWWAENSIAPGLKHSVTFNGGSSVWSCAPNAAAYARGNLTSAPVSWAITDANSCVYTCGTFPPLNTYPSLPVLVNYTKNNQGPIVNGSLFAGLSYDQRILWTCYFCVTNTNVVNLYTLLGPGVVRLLGDSPYWTAAGSGLTANQVAPSDINRLALFLKRTNWTVIYGIPLSQFNPSQAASEAAYVATALGNSLYGFEFGNEVDEYQWNGVRPVSYDVFAFIAQWEQYRTSVLAAVPGAPLTGPVSAHFTDWTTTFAKNVTNQITTLTQHYYLSDGTLPTTATMAAMLTPDPTLPGTVSALSAVAATSNIINGYRIDEAGSFYNGGSPGVSNSFGSAFWTLNFLFTVLQNGASGVNLHGGEGTWYSPIFESSGEVYAVAPGYYSMFLFSLMKGGQLLNASLTSSYLNSFNSYAVILPSGAVYSLLMNSNSTYSMSVNVTWGSAVSTATAMLLTAPSLNSISGITFGGKEIGLDGSWASCQNYSIAVIGGSSSITVPPNSIFFVKAT